MLGEALAGEWQMAGSSGPWRVGGKCGERWQMLKTRYFRVPTAFFGLTMCFPHIERRDLAQTTRIYELNM